MEKKQKLVSVRQEKEPEKADENEFVMGADEFENVRIADFGSSITHQTDTKRFDHDCLVIVLHYLGMCASFNGLICTEDHRRVTKLKKVFLDSMYTQLHKLGKRVDTMFPHHIRSSKYTTKNVSNILCKKNIPLISQLMNTYLTLHRGDFTKQVDMSALISAWSLIVSHQMKTMQAFKCHNAEKAAVDWNKEFYKNLTAEKITLNDFFWLCVNLIDRQYLPEELKQKEENRIRMIYCDSYKVFTAIDQERTANPAELGFPRPVQVKRSAKNAASSKRKVV